MNKKGRFLNRECIDADSHDGQAVLLGLGDWLNDWLIDWLIAYLTTLLINWLTNWLSEWLINGMINLSVSSIAFMSTST